LQRNGKVTALPIASKGAYRYEPDTLETEDLPPHRAAVPVHAKLMAHTAAVRRRYVIALSVAFSLALHGGFFAAAMVWGQGEPLPETKDGVAATIQIQVTQEHIRETIAAKPVAEGEGEKVEVLRIETVASPAETAPSLLEELGEGAESQRIETTGAPANDEAIAEAAPDTAPPVAGEDVSNARRDPAFATQEHIQPTVAVVTPPPPAAVAEPPRQVEAAAATAAGGESYLPSAPAAGQLPDASHETVEQPLPRRKRGTRAEKGEMASVAQSGGLPRGARHASASRVALFAYRRRIRARVMQRLPQGQLGAGRVVIGLRVSRWGQLLGTYVARSSGSAILDQAALNCVRMAGPYPRPPSGATAAQLALSMDFRFE
jgi:periplasmic protein TonB